MKFSNIDKTVGKSMIAVAKSMIFCDEPFSKYNN